MSTRILTRPSPSQPTAPGRRRRWPLLRRLAVIVTLPVLLAAFALWWFLLGHDTPSAVSLDQALSGIEASAPTTAATGATATDPSTPAAAAASPTDGTWKIDRTITNAQGTGSFAGFRIDEVLVGVGSTTAVGRTTTVDGSITASGSTLTAAHVSVGLTDITTNDSRRNDAVQRALSTSRYPEATFVLTRPVDVGSIPTSGQKIDVAATGDLTIKGVTQTVTIDLQAQLQGDVLVVVGSAPVVLADYGVTAPTAPVVASVADHGTFEFQLYFKKA
jgi:polyisoprenoid-binding protein YceI